MLTHTERSQALFALVQSLPCVFVKVACILWFDTVSNHILDTTSLNPFGCTSSQWVRSHNPVQQTSGSHWVRADCCSPRTMWISCWSFVRHSQSRRNWELQLSCTALQPLSKHQSTSVLFWRQTKAPIVHLFEAVHDWGGHKPLHAVRTEAVAKWKNVAICCYSAAIPWVATCLGLPGGFAVSRNEFARRVTYVKIMYVHPQPFRRKFHGIFSVFHWFHISICKMFAW